MMKRFKIFFAIIVLCFVGLISCSSDSDSDDDTFYISYKNVDGAKSGEWTGGVTPQSKVPFASYRTADTWTYCTAFKKTTSKTDITASINGRNDFDHIYIGFLGKTVGTPITGSNAYIGIRITDVNGDSYFPLTTNRSITITKYSDDYIEGNYTGEDFSGATVTGSFVLKNFGDDDFILW